MHRITVRQCIRAGRAITTDGAISKYTRHPTHEDDPRRGADTIPADAPEPPTATSTSMVVAYTDGACIGNPGPGGWGVHIEYPDGRPADLGGGEEFSTNNKMELSAAIEAVRLTLDWPSVTIVTDSEYVQKGITRWIARWKRNGWINSDGKPVANQDLWEEASMP